MAHKKALHLGLLIVLLVSMFVFAGAASAQIRDRDGDGVPDASDNCPTVPGSAANAGCPGADDRDGDGVADFVDACPDQAGTGFTNGCPVDIVVTVPAPTPELVMIWDSMDECMFGVPMNADSPVNVREYPTINSAVLGQIPPGFQWSPWFRDYDENSEVWLAGAPVNGMYGWVKGSALINNGQCVNLPQVIHVDAPVDDPYVVEFDPDLIPTLTPDDDGVSIRDLLELDILVVPDDLFPLPTSTPTPVGVATPFWNPEVPGQIYVMDGFGLPLIFPDGSDGAGDPIPTETLSLNFTKLVFVHPPDPDIPCIAPVADFCMNAVLLLPASGPAAENCPPEALMETLIGLVGDPFVGDPFVDDPYGGNALIGLLLPAVQKWANAGQLPGDGSVVPGDGSVRIQDFNFLLGDGSVMPADAEQDFNLLLPAVQCPVFLMTPQEGGITDGTLPVDFNLLLPAV